MRPAPVGKIAILLFTASLFLAGSCSSKAGDKPQASSPTETVTRNAVIVFVEGRVECQLSEGGAWLPASIGDEVPEKARLRTGAASSCQLQFGQASIVMIAPNSVLYARAVQLAKSRNAVEIELFAGSVLSKVHKLADKGDRFQVRTKYAVCAVRGTQFLVSCEDGRSTKVGVREGRVAIVPASYDESQFASAKASDVESAVESIMKNSPVVEANQEARITDQSLRATEPSIAKATAALASGQAVSSALAEYLAAAPQGAAAIQVQSAETRRSLEAAESLTIRETLPAKVMPPTSATPAGSAAPAAPASPAAPKVPASPAAAVSASPAAPASSSPPPAVESPAREVSLKPGAIYGLVRIADGPLGLGLASASGRIVAVDSRGRLHAFDREGHALWSADSGNSINQSGLPVIQDGGVLFAGDKKLAAFDLQSGAKQASFDLTKSDSALFGRRPIIAAGKYVISSELGLSIYDPAGDGSPRTAALPESSDASPAPYGKDLVIATRSGLLCVIDGGDLSVKCQIKTGASQPIALRPVIRGDTAFLIDRKGLVSCVDIAGQKLKWEKRLESGKSVQAYADPLLSEGGLYVVAKSSLYALSPDSGERLFAPRREVCGLPFISEGVLWIGAAGPSGAPSLCGLDPATGAEKRSISLPAKAEGLPVLVDGLVAVPLADGEVAFVNCKADGGK
jgi:outer membrane protein assembly factor BamB